MAEIVGAALLILFLALQIMPVVKNVSISSDKLIAAVDTKIKEQITAGSGSSGSGANSQNTYVINLTLNQSPIIIPKQQNGGGYINFSIPPGVPPNAIKVEVNFTFDYVFYDPVNSNTVFEQGTKTVKFGFNFLNNSSYYEDSFDFAPNYFNVTGNFDPYIVFYDTGANNYTVSGALSINNSLCKDALKIIPKSEYIIFYY